MSSRSNFIVPILSDWSISFQYERRKPGVQFLFETRSSPDSLGATHRAFAFYPENPISSIPDSNISVSFVFFRGEIQTVSARPSLQRTRSDGQRFKLGCWATAPQFYPSDSCNPWLKP